VKRVTTAGDLRFDRDGALLFGGVLSAAEVAALADRLEPQITGRPGTRLKVEPDVATLLAADGAVGRVAAGLIGPDAIPVRAVLFDKSPDANWIVAWHQDRTIPVRERRRDARASGRGRPRTASCTSHRRSQCWRGWSP
jgi:predicted NAD/FAD-binding protein